jgi:hypothetical protein
LNRKNQIIKGIMITPPPRPTNPPKRPAMRPTKKLIITIRLPVSTKVQSSRFRVNAECAPRIIHTVPQRRISWIILCHFLKVKQPGGPDRLCRGMGNVF